MQSARSPAPGQLPSEQLAASRNSVISWDPAVVVIKMLTGGTAGSHPPLLCLFLCCGMTFHNRIKGIEVTETTDSMDLEYFVG